MSEYFRRICADQLERELNYKYSPPIRNKSVFFKLAESPGDYFTRLEDLYPSDLQQAYIKALQSSITTGTFGLVAAFYFVEGIDPLPSLDEYFSREENLHLKNAQCDINSFFSEKNEEIIVRMRETPAREIAKAGSHAAYLFEQMIHKRLHKRREELDDFIFAHHLHSANPSEVIDFILLKTFQLRDLLIEGEEYEHQESSRVMSHIVQSQQHAREEARMKAESLQILFCGLISRMKSKKQSRKSVRMQTYLTSGH